MPSQGRGLARVLAAGLAAILVATCSSGPVSDVSEPPTTAPPSAPTSAAPPTDPPPSQEAEPTPTLAPTVAPPVGEPGRPTGTTFKLVSEQPAANGGVRRTYRITWQAPEGEATSFLVYGVKSCLRASKANHGKPCVVRGMRIPRAQLAQLAQAPGASRSIDVGWVVPRSGRSPFPAVLIRAANDHGESIFTIVHSDDVCWRC